MNMKRLKDLYENNNQILNDAFDRIVAEIHIKKQKNGDKIFLICGCEPGVGTTTIAINIAIAMAKAGWKTLLIDADLRKIGEDKRLSGQEMGFADYLSGRVERLDNLICNTNYDSLHYLESGNDVKNAISVLCAASMKEMLEKLKEEYDYIIIDAPSVSTAIDASILATEADSVVLVTAHQSGQKKMVVEAKQQMDRVGAEVSGIIVNKIEMEEYRSAMKNYDYFKQKRYLTKKATKRERKQQK